MTWLGYAIIITNEQKVWALFMALGFAMFGCFCGRPLWMCLVVIPIIYVVGVVYAINENAMYQIKAEFCDKHHEMDRCAPYWH